jgi:hypothetical protein
MMRKGILLLTAFVLFSGSAWAQLPCTPTTENHERWPVKTRDVSPNFVDDVKTVADVIRWVVPHVSGWKTMPPETLIADENTRVTVSGYVLLVKHADDDCDLHVEIAGSKSATAVRIIAEVPPTNPHLQMETLTVLGLSTLDPGSKHLYDAKNAPHVEISGLAFLDVSHQLALKDKNGHTRTMAELKKGNNHGTARVGTLWEIHPVGAIRIVQ